MRRVGDDPRSTSIVVSEVRRSLTKYCIVISSFDLRSYSSITHESSVPSRPEGGTESGQKGYQRYVRRRANFKSLLNSPGRFLLHTKFLVFRNPGQVFQPFHRFVNLTFRAIFPPRTPSPYSLTLVTYSNGSYVWFSRYSPRGHAHLQQQGHRS